MRNTILIGIIAALVYISYAAYQPVYTYALLDSRYDAHKYLKAYQFFAQNFPTLSLSYPFNLRLLVPFVASKMPFSSPELDFIWLNGICIVLTIMLLVNLWRHLQIPFSAISVGVFWILFHWKGLVRMYLPDPITADVMGYLWQVVWLYIFLKIPSNPSKTFMAILVAILGTLQKESFVAIALLTTIVYAQERNTKLLKISLLASCVAIIAYLLISYYSPAATPDWRNNSVVSILRGIKRYISQPELFVRLPTSWLMAYGFLWVGLLYQPRFLSIRLLNYSLFMWLLLSAFGGGDTTRIFYNGMPFVLTFFLLQFRQKPIWQPIFALITSISLMRLYQLEPNLGLYPQQAHNWCVECWSIAESWVYWVYTLVVLASYYYLTTYLRVATHESNNINPSS